MVKTLAEKGGLEGYFTNHSLWSSCATRMYEAGVDEKLIMETTGHKSECVRQYKRTSEDLLRAAQQTVSKCPPSKKVKTGPSATVSNSGFGEDIVEVSDSEWFDSNVHSDDDETVSYKVNESGKSSCAHKNPCNIAGKKDSCPKMCEVLKVVDKCTDELKRKRSCLSLKFVKTKSSK